MIRRQRIDSQPRILIAAPCRYRMGLDLIPVRSRGVRLRVFADVLLIGQQDVFHHRRKLGRAIGLDNILPAMDPGGEHQIRQSYRMVGMQMGDEEAVQIDCAPGDFAGGLRFDHALHDAMSAIQQIGLIVNGNRQPGADSVWLGIRRSCPQHQNLGRHYPHRRRR